MPAESHRWSTPEALLFDLGGVLIDIDFGRVFDYWARAAGMDPKVVGEHFAFDEHYERHERGEIGIEDYLAAVDSKLGLGLQMPDLMSGWNRIFIGEKPGVPALIAMLAGAIPIYVFSNTNGHHHEFWANAYADLLGQFDKVYVSSTVGARKPDVEAYERVLADMGRRPEAVLFFDDNPHNVAGALAAGLMARQVSEVETMAAALEEAGVLARK